MANSRAAPFELAGAGELVSRETHVLHGERQLLGDTVIANRIGRQRSISLRILSCIGTADLGWTRLGQAKELTVAEKNAK